MASSRTQMFLSFCSAVPSGFTSISGLCLHGQKMAARFPDITWEHYDKKKRDYFFPWCLCFISKETFLKVPIFLPLTSHISLSDTNTLKRWVTQTPLNRSLAREWNLCDWRRPIKIHLFRVAWLLDAWAKPRKKWGKCLLRKQLIVSATGSEYEKFFYEGNKESSGILSREAWWSPCF